jgi:hypothetical protein
MQDLQEQPAQAQAMADAKEARDYLELTMRIARLMQSDEDDD